MNCRSAISRLAAFWTVEGCHFFDPMRLILQSNPVRVMVSDGQAVNHLDEMYDGQPSDIWDNADMIVDFASGARAMLELCMFAEDARFQEEISAVGPSGKIECQVPGPGRFWPAHLGAATSGRSHFRPAVSAAAKEIAAAT